MACALVNRLKEELREAKAEVSAMQQQMAERESTAAAELAASEAGLREARQKLRHLEAQQPLISGVLSVQCHDLPFPGCDIFAFGHTFACIFWPN